LANDLGNLLSRVLTMVGKYYDGRIPAAGAEEGSDRELRETAIALPDAIDADLAVLAFNRYLQDVWQLVTRANRYVEENAPWTLAKKNDMARLASVLYNLAESLRLTALYLYPVMPGTAQKIWTAIGIDRKLTASRMEQERKWGTLAVGLAVRPEGQLFPRIDTKRTKETTVENSPTGQKPVDKKETPGPDLIGIEDFTKVELRVGRIVAAERVERSEKLVKLRVDIGSEVRQVVAGIGKQYGPEQLVDKRIVIVANLKPAKLMGIESQGMLLAASSGDVLSVLTPDREILPGAKVK
jgi:methionyl-tRNA synthetase